MTHHTAFDFDRSTSVSPLSGQRPSDRLDKWLWHTRFFKSRSLASKLCNSGKIRIDGVVVTKAHYQVRPGQVLTFVQGNHIRIVRVSGIPERRGPALEAQLFYDDLDPPGVDNFVPATLV